MAARHEPRSVFAQLHGVDRLRPDGQRLQERVGAVDQPEQLHASVHAPGGQQDAPRGCVRRAGDVRLVEALGEAQAHGCHVIHAQHAQRIACITEGMHIP